MATKYHPGPMADRLCAAAAAAAAWLFCYRSFHRPLPAAAAAGTARCVQCG